MELCKSVGRKRDVEIVGIGVLDDMGLCSDKCKLYEVVCPYGKCGDRVYRGCENGGGRCLDFLLYLYRSDSNMD